MGRLFFTGCLLAFNLLSLAQTNTSLYVKQWKEIDSLVFKHSLSRSALEKVNVLYKQAKEKDQSVQMIKALLYKLHLQERFQEKDINDEIKFLATESENSKDVLTKSILSSLVAEKYRNYFERSRWQIYQRSKTINYKKEDIATWNIEDLHAAITSWYQKSLQADFALKKADIDVYRPILTLFNTKVFRPSLYDLLAHRALNYFKSDETYITKPTYAFTLNDTTALGNIQAFIDHSFVTKDSSSNKWKALLLFQELIGFHLERKDTAALIDVNLERIEFARSSGSITTSDSLYYKAVRENVERFQNNRYSAQAWYLLANWHSQKANQYNPVTDTSYRWENVKALEICQRFLPLKDSTEGHYNLSNLYHSIVASHLRLSTEQVNIPGLPFRTLVTFKNVNRLYYRVIKFTQKIEDAIDKARATRGWNSDVDTATSFAYSLEQQVNLPDNKDYQQHNAEIKIGALPSGKYFLLTSSAADFSKTSRLALSTFYVSNISFVNNGPHYFVLDRTTGQPLTNATATIWEMNYSNRQRRNQRTRRESYVTDKNGYFKVAITKENNRNINLQIRHNQDELFMEDNQYVTPLSYSSNNDDDDYDSEEEYEEDHSKAFFFKDRSIYRPGQVVYFKIIALTKDRKTKQTKLYTSIDPKERFYVYLEDVNNRKVDSLLIKLNDYGSFAGSFKLPVNVLTGEFSLTTDFDRDQDGEFSVEEYKRPTYYVQLEKPKGTYRVNDTLTITGTVKAYAGNTVDGVNIKYRVTRRGRFLYVWRWHTGIRPASSEAQITFGEAKTDASGKFTIKFAATPDEAISKETLPVFDFEVNADVTDVAGETRSSTTTVSAGYHSINLKLLVKETAEADSLKSFFVSTENIAGDKEPASVKISIYPLQSPSQLIRKRYWQQPDQFIYTQEEYKGLFPTDEYKDENNKENWSTSSAVFTETINTKETGKVQLLKGKLTPGWYLIEAVTTDKDGNEIKDRKYVQLFSKNEGQFKGSNYLFNSINNNLTSPGFSASFLVGSSAENVYLIQETQHKPKGKSTLIQSDFTYHSINKAVKEITVRTGVEDIGGMGVNFVFVKDNRVYYLNERVIVEVENNDLNVEVLTYRDKVEPGNLEKWSVKVTGKNKEAAAAEVLTSMYDASLDQFKPHRWQIPSESPEIFYNNGWDNNSGFRLMGSSENSIQIPNKYFWKEYADIDVYLSKAQLIFLNRNDTVLVSDLNGEISSYEIRQRMSSPTPPPPSPQNMNLAGRLAGLDVSAEEVVVVGYGAQKRRNLTGAATSVTMRGSSALTGSNNPLYVVDGMIVSSIDGINSDDIANMEVLKDAAATALYGERGANGVVVITTKNGLGKREEPVLKVRTNFNETAFFLPQLSTDKDGNLSFTFTLPDALTQWKWQILSHNKLANFGLNQKTIVSQKTLMVQANAPRFMREGDSMHFSAKVSNLSDKELNGKVTLQLVDAVTSEPIDDLFTNTSPVQNFATGANQSAAVHFSIAVPANFNKPLTWRIIAKAGQFADGEENSLPILTNRILVTESLPLFVKGDSTKQFRFEKLLTQQSKTLKHESITVEYTSNPIWYVIQSLPYLTDYPYECSEQTFNRFFANALASKITNSNPRIKQIFELWKKDTSALKSNLQKNEELKSTLLQETPWVLQAESEEQQKRNLALLFESFKLQQSFKNNIEKLKQMQLNSGGFPWFKGGNEDRYITQYIVSGIGRLQKMNAIPPQQNEALLNIAEKALRYLDEEITDDYKNLLKYKTNLKKNNTDAIQIQYLYAKSFFNNKTNKEAYNYYYGQAKQYWQVQSHYLKAMIGEVLLRNNEVGFVTQNILPAIMENAVTGGETGMYWKENEHSYYWYHAPVEQQALMIEFANEVSKQQKQGNIQKQIDEMKNWLLRQKQTTHWRTTKATADACYALLLNGSDWVSTNKKVTIQLGDYSFGTTPEQEAGTGYFKTRIEAPKVTPAVGNIRITTSSTGKNSSTSPLWGSVYWQYFEDLNKITSAATPLAINKKLFVEHNTGAGIVLKPVNDGDELKVGNKIKIRIEIKVDRNMEYVHLKDMRAASMEPINVLSGYKWQDGLGYYESTRDAATNFFINYLPKGTYVFEYPVNITHSGNYSVGITSAQCMYAPEFNSHSEVCWVFHH